MAPLFWNRSGMGRGFYPVLNPSLLHSHILEYKCQKLLHRTTTNPFSAPVYLNLHAAEGGEVCGLQSMGKEAGVEKGVKTTGIQQSELR